MNTFIYGSYPRVYMKQIVKNMIDSINRRPENEPLPLFSALGVSRVVYSEDFVQFKVKGDRGVNKVKVIYDEGQDLYNVEFWNIKGLNCKKVNSINGVFFDILTDIIWRGVVHV